MKITKSELKQIIKEALIEELGKKSSKRRIREAVDPNNEFATFIIDDLGNVASVDILAALENGVGGEMQQWVPDKYCDFDNGDCTVNAIKGYIITDPEFDYSDCAGAFLDNGEYWYVDAYENWHKARNELDLVKKLYSCARGLEESCKRRRVREAVRDNYIILRTYKDDNATRETTVEGRYNNIEKAKKDLQKFYDEDRDAILADGEEIDEDESYIDDADLTACICGSNDHYNYTICYEIK